MFHKITHGKFKNFKRFPEEIQMCSLYDTNDLDNEINITNHLISNNLAWPLKHKDDHDPSSADDNDALTSCGLCDII
jgi:hypothetical protein